MVSSLLLEKAMGEFPSGQRGQTVNLLALPSVVRIHLRPFTYLLRATVLARMRLISAIGMYEKRICRSGGTGRRPGLKIPWVVIPVPVRSRFAARLRALIHTNRSSFSISIFQPSAPTTSLAAARSVLCDAAARRPSLLASMQYHSR